jgi:hypothetical protein
VTTKTTLLFLTLILCACSTGISTPQVLPARSPTDTPSAPTPTSTPDVFSTQCGYQWAYQDLPDLTAQFDPAVKSLIPDSTSRATAFGENCVAANGQVVRFLAMETDFYVFATVDTLNDYETFGNWIAQVIQVVNGYSPEMIAGPKPGFVEFRFEKSMTESISFRVPIQGYNGTADGKTGEELLRLFYTGP